MSTAASQNDYEFFQHMDQSSIYKAVKSLSNGAGSESSSVNRFFDCDIVNKTGLDISVCNKFNKLISSLCSSELGVTRNKPLNDSDYKYLNFWANYKINISGFFGNDYIAAFYDSVSSEIEQCFTINKLKGALQYKEKSYMEKIKTIDYLYRNYYDMRDIILSSSTEKFGKCLEYSQNCFNEYKKVIDIDQDSNKNFYDALINFKKNYDQLAHKALNRNRSYAEYIVKMPEYSTSNMILYSMENDSNKIMLISLFGSVFAVVLILIYLCMCTPLGKRLRYKKENKKKIFHNLSQSRNTPLYFNDNNHVYYDEKKYNLTYNSA
ncbi:hypothetical protein PVPAM_130015200 [Plasmodium vivax]|nr:hypothetical protein PVPAM_130015200 [Plasmodium vivax]